MGCLPMQITRLPFGATRTNGMTCTTFRVSRAKRYGFKSRDCTSDEGRDRSARPQNVARSSAASAFTYAARIPCCRQQNKKFRCHYVPLIIRQEQSPSTARKAGHALKDRSACIIRKNVAHSEPWPVILAPGAQRIFRDESGRGRKTRPQSGRLLGGAGIQPGSRAETKTGAGEVSQTFVSKRRNMRATPHRRRLAGARTPMSGGHSPATRKKRISK